MATASSAPTCSPDVCGTAWRNATFVAINTLKSKAGWKASACRPDHVPTRTVRRSASGPLVRASSLTSCIEDRLLSKAGTRRSIHSQQRLKNPIGYPIGTLVGSFFRSLNLCWSLKRIQGMWPGWGGFFMSFCSRSVSGRWSMAMTFEDRGEASGRGWVTSGFQRPSRTPVAYTLPGIL